MTGQSTIYVSSFMCMVARHMCLAAWSMVQPDVSGDLGFTSTDLGAMDMTYLYAYAIGNMLNGQINDRFPIRRVVPCGMLMAGTCYATALILSHFRVLEVWPYVVLWGGSGLSQSTVWSGTVSLMANWFPPESRGKVLGSWSSNASCGNIFGSLSAGVLLLLGVSWPLIVLVEVLLLWCVALTFFTVARDRPAAETLTERKQAIQFWAAWKIPGVLVYAVDFAFVKLLNYGMLFWLPYFLVNHLQVNGLQRGLIAASYDVGAVLGSAVTGWVSDRVGSRPLALAPMLTLAIPLFYSLRFGTSVWPYFVLVPLLGWAVGASANVLYSAGAADVAKSEDESGARLECTATVAGIIDGTGSLGAGLGQILIGYLRTISWDLVFGFLMGRDYVGVGACAVLVLLPW